SRGRHHRRGRPRHPRRAHAGRGWRRGRRPGGHHHASRRAVRRRLDLGAAPHGGVRLRRRARHPERAHSFGHAGGARPARPGHRSPPLRAPHPAGHADRSALTMDWAVILAGGSGTRFWPLSTPSRPKHLLPLTGARSTAEETLDPLTGFIARSRILVVTAPAVAAELTARLRLDPANVLVEPRAASTGPALVWATAEASRRDPSATVLSLHADWVVGDAAVFARTAESALFSAR